MRPCPAAIVVPFVTCAGLLTTDESIVLSLQHAACLEHAKEISRANSGLCKPCRFRLLNVRTDMRFILVTDLEDWLGQFRLLATSPVISPANPNAPLQGHLMRTIDPR